nr:DUF4097 domain-containing protein [Actinomycetales bacterium]
MTSPTATPTPPHTPPHAPPHTRQGYAQPIGRARPANPAVRAFVTVFGLLVLLGAVGLYAVGAAVGGPRWNTTEFEGSAPLDGTREVVVSTHRADITVVSTSGADLTWTGQLAGNPDHLKDNAVDRSGERLTLSPELRGPLGLSNGFTLWGDRDHGQLTVDVPTSPLRDLRLETGTGDTSATGEWGHLSIDSGIGNVTLGGTTDSLDLSAGIGDVNGTLVVDGGPLTVRGGIGDISLTLVDAVPASVELSGGVGEVTLNLPPTTMGYVVGGGTGIGGTTNSLPGPTPDGIPVDAPVRVTVNGGVGGVLLGPSAP